MAAILATGGAALTVNATVLNPQAETTSSGTDQPQLSPSSAPAADSSLAANEFQIPGVGLVTLMTIGGKLALESVVVNDGFSYVINESTPGQFDIRFESSDRVVNFTAQLADGQIVTSATSMSTPAATPAPQTTQAPASGAAPGSGGGSAPYDGGDDDYDYDDDDDGYEYDDDDDGGDYDGGDHDGDDD